MLNKKRVALLSSIAIVLIFACIYSFSGTLNFGWSDKLITESNPATTHPPVLGKELQSVNEYLTEDVLISLRTTSVYHSSRLSVLVLIITWMQSVPCNQVITCTVKQF